jgi:hypothetical protein
MRFSFFKVHLVQLFFVCAASILAHSTSSATSLPPHLFSLSNISASMHLLSAVFVPVLDFDSLLCHTRIDITLRTILQAPCSDDESDIRMNIVCSALDTFAFTLENISLSVLPSESLGSEGQRQQQFEFDADQSLHVVFNDSVKLKDMGTAYHVRVFTVQSFHSHSMQWCGSAATRVAVRAELHHLNELGMHGVVQYIHGKEFVVVHLPDKACVDLDEQTCFDVGVDAGCFWCERARRCLHSSRSIDDATAKCSTLSEPSPSSALDGYSSVRCTGGLQTWPIGAPLSNRNRICMMQSVCMADGQLTLFLPPPSTSRAFADSQSSIHSVRGMAHYDGWSSLTHIHHDVKHPDGDRSGFIPRVKTSASVQVHAFQSLVDHFVSSYA